MRLAVTNGTGVQRTDPVEFILATLGFIVVLLMLPFVLVLSGPVSGWVIGAVLFTLSWGAQHFLTRMASHMDDTHAVGIIGIGSIGRAFVVVGILFVVALEVGRVVGLVAAGVFAVAFTFDLTGRSVLFSTREKRKRLASEDSAA